MINYYYDDTHELKPYTFCLEATEDTEPPDNAVRVAPPEYKQGENHPCLINGVWKLVVSHVGKTIYDTKTQNAKIVDYIGEIEDGFTLIPPPIKHPQYAKWDGSKWIIDKELKAQNDEENSLIPIVSLFGNKDFANKPNHQKAGYGLVNSEAIGAIVNRVDVGHYEILNTNGLATTQDVIKQSEDRNGNVGCFVADPIVDKDNRITILVYKKRWDMETCEVVAGQPMDIPVGRWIDVKLSMPIKKED